MQSSHDTAFSLNGSAFGQGSAGGITNLRCTGSEAALMECDMNMATQCRDDAGVICCKC